MNQWVAVKKKKSKKRLNHHLKPQAPPPPPIKQVPLIWVTPEDWNSRFDPIDKEMYSVLRKAHPYMMTKAEILEKLIEMDPEENEEYTLDDVSDSIELCLKAYLDISADETRFQLRKNPEVFY